MVAICLSFANITAFAADEDMKAVLKAYYDKFSSSWMASSAADTAIAGYPEKLGGLMSYGNKGIQIFQDAHTYAGLVLQKNEELVDESEYTASYLMLKDAFEDKLVKRSRKDLEDLITSVAHILRVDANGNQNALNADNDPKYNRDAFDKLVGAEWDAKSYLQSEGTDTRYITNLYDDLDAVKSPTELETVTKAMFRATFNEYSKLVETRGKYTDERRGANGEYSWGQTWYDIDSAGGLDGARGAKYDTFEQYRDLINARSSENTSIKEFVDARKDMQTCIDNVKGFTPDATGGLALSSTRANLANIHNQIVWTLNVNGTLAAQNYKLNGTTITGVDDGDKIDPTQGTGPLTVLYALIAADLGKSVKNTPAISDPAIGTCPNASSTTIGTGCHLAADCNSTQGPNMKQYCSPTGMTNHKDTWTYECIGENVTLVGCGVAGCTNETDTSATASDPCGGTVTVTATCVNASANFWEPCDPADATHCGADNTDAIHCGGHGDLSIAAVTDGLFTSDNRITNGNGFTVYYNTLVNNGTNNYIYLGALKSNANATERKAYEDSLTGFWKGTRTLTFTANVDLGMRLAQFVTILPDGYAFTAEKAQAEAPAAFDGANPVIVSGMDVNRRFTAYNNPVGNITNDGHKSQTDKPLISFLLDFYADAMDKDASDILIDEGVGTPKYWDKAVTAYNARYTGDLGFYELPTSPQSQAREKLAFAGRIILYTINDCKLEGTGSWKTLLELRNLIASAQLEYERGKGIPFFALGTFDVTTALLAATDAAIVTSRNNERDGETITNRWNALNTALVKYTKTLNAFPVSVQEAYELIQEAYDAEDDDLLELAEKLAATILTVDPDQTGLVWEAGDILLNGRFYKGGLTTTDFPAVTATDYTKISSGNITDIEGTLAAYNAYNALNTALNPPEPEKPDFLLGDVDGDGKVTATDALWILQYVVGSREFDEDQEAAADVNEDGEINATDALWVLQLVVGTRESLGKAD
ncbi:MAG: dockerin type I repeat-containing protein [Oscillospiraceae bacterium]|nr:dockerin type I repeat-containing protein [Oscillospiraceae bacterium]